MRNYLNQQTKPGILKIILCLIGYITFDIVYTELKIKFMEPYFTLDYFNVTLHP